MHSANSTLQTLPVAGMSNQYDPQLLEEAAFIHLLYPGATYIRVKYLDRDKNRVSLKVGAIIDGHTVKLHLTAYGFDNMYRNLFSRLDSQPGLSSALRTKKVS